MNRVYGENLQRLAVPGAVRLRHALKSALHSASPVVRTSRRSLKLFDATFLQGLTELSKWLSHSHMLDIGDSSGAHMNQRAQCRGGDDSSSDSDSTTMRPGAFCSRSGCPKAFPHDHVDGSLFKDDVKAELFFGVSH